VIWEAFQPETEPRRSFRRSVELAKAQTEKPPETHAAAGNRRPAPRRASNTPADSGEFLQRQGGIY
jgi:penicillin-binding protein 1A